MTKMKVKSPKIKPTSKTVNKPVVKKFMSIGGTEILEFENN